MKFYEKYVGPGPIRQIKQGGLCPRLLGEENTVGLFWASASGPI